MALFLVIIGFGWLIFVHELGHFIVAKWAGVRCPQFSIGFGHAICSWRRGIGFRFGSTEKEFTRRANKVLEEKGIDPEQATTKQINDAGDSLSLGETEYRLNYLPLGGYVKMVGQEDLDPTAASDDPRSFTRQKIWKRACILSAGVVMNLIFGLIFFIIAFMVGVYFPPAIVGGTVPDSPAAMTYAQGHNDNPAFQGLKVGDHITKINGKKTTDLQDVQIATALTDPGSTVQMTIKRNGINSPLIYNIQPVRNDNLGRLASGIIGPSNLNIVGLVESGPAASQGLKTQMRVVKINGKNVSKYSQARSAIIDARGKPVTATFAPYDSDGNLIKSDKQVDIKLRASASLSFGKQNTRNLIGLVPAVRVAGVAKTLPEGSQNKSPAKLAGIKTGDILVQIGSFSWPNRSELVKAVHGADKNKSSIEIKVWRSGKILNLGKLTPSNGRVGIVMDDAPGRISKTLDSSPLSKINLPAGSVIKSIDGKKISSWDDMQRVFEDVVAKHLGKKSNSNSAINNRGKNSHIHQQSSTLNSLTIPITYQLNISGNPKEKSQITLDKKQIKEIANTHWLMPMGIAFGQKRVRIGSSNPVSAAILGAVKTKQFMIQTYISVLRLIQGSVDVKQLRGPVGIVQIGTHATQQGWAYLLFFLGVISVNLAVLNFLPLPVVDGGHVLFLIIEKLKGSPVRASIQIATMIVGLVLIASVMLFATYNDIVRLITGG